MCSENLPTIIDPDLEIWYFNLYSCGYHAYMNIWIPLIGDESLICQKEKGNGYDLWLLLEITLLLDVQNICDHFWKFLPFKFLPKTPIHARVLGKRVNRGANYCLEIVCLCIVFGIVK